MLNNGNNEFDGKCTEATCRSCARRGLDSVLDLGRMPLSDGFLSEDQLREPERRYPLGIAFCPDCSLVQIVETVPPEVLFCDDYPYFSSFSDALLAHSKNNAASLIEKLQLDKNSFVVEIASNDGYLLKNFVERGIQVLGIDPAEGPARAAENVGVPTMCTFFNKETASRLRASGKQADLIIANNVLAHVDDTNDLVEAIGLLLKDSGVSVIEVPYVKDLIDYCEFDTIYHEHHCYFSVTALNLLFRRHGLFLNAIERLSIHGGSLRLYVSRQEDVGESVQRLLVEEAEAGVNEYSYYQGFGSAARRIRKGLGELLADLKSQGKTIAGYGAAAKGTILLNYVKAGRETIDFVVDRNVHKQGKYVPGVRIPIDEPGRIIREMPDYVLLLPWNFKDEILTQQASYREQGGRFIIPIPEPVVV